MKLAADIFDFQQVTDGVHGHVRVWENGLDICQSWCNYQWYILPWCAADSAAIAFHMANLWQFFYLPAIQCSCTLGLWVNQPSGMAGTTFNFPDLWLRTVEIWSTKMTTKFGEKCSPVALPDYSLCRWWTEAMYAMSGAWLGAKCDHCFNIRVAQTYPCTYLCQRKTFKHLTWNKRAHIC